MAVTSQTRLHRHGASAWAATPVEQIPGSLSGRPGAPLGGSDTDRLPATCYPHHGVEGLCAVARVVLYCAEKEPGHCVFGQEKNNLESNVPFALGYDFTKLAVGYDEKRRKAITASRLVWDGREIDSVERIVLDREGADERGERRRRSCG